MKRAVDIALSGWLLLLSAPLVLLLAVLIRLESSGPALVQAHRVGRNGRMIKVWEFRAANTDPDAMETISGCEGEQVTRIGRWLRKTGLVHWPWLWTVLRGDFSIVGPRAEMPRYVGVYPPALRKVVLSVKPGLIDLALVEGIANAHPWTGLDRDEQETLYVEKIIPARLECGKRYVENRGFFMDLRVFWGFILKKRF